MTKPLILQKQVVCIMLLYPLRSLSPGSGLVFNMPVAVFFFIKLKHIEVSSFDDRFLFKPILNLSRSISSYDICVTIG